MISSILLATLHPQSKSSDVTTQRPVAIIQTNVPSQSKHLIISSPSGSPLVLDVHLGGFRTWVRWVDRDRVLAESNKGELVELGSYRNGRFAASTPPKVLANLNGLETEHGFDISGDLKLAFANDEHGNIVRRVMANSSTTVFVKRNHFSGSIGYPSISPDGRWVAFSTATAQPYHPGRDRDWMLWMVKSDGTGLKKVGIGLKAKWSRDSTEILAIEGTEDGGRAVHVYNLAHHNSTTVLKTEVLGAGFSADGKSITWAGSDQNWRGDSAVYQISRHTNRVQTLVRHSALGPVDNLLCFD